MDFSLEAHVIAGLGTLGLGTAALLRRPSHPHNLLFALLCGALTLWNLGYAISQVGQSSRAVESLYLAGSCLAAPLGLHLALFLAGHRSASMRRLVWPAYALAAVLWISIWTPAYLHRQAWNLGAMAVIGSVLTTALAVLSIRAFRLPAGPERGAYRMMVGGAVVAVAGGLTDFLPRDVLGLPKVGSIFLLGFLLVVCALVIRDRFLDIDRFLAGAIMLLILAVAFTSVIYLTIHLAGPRYLTLLGVVLVLLALLALVARRLVPGARSMLAHRDPFVEELFSLSRTIQHATDVDAIWTAVSAAGKRLPVPPRLSVYLRSGGPGRLRKVHPGGAISPEESGFIRNPRALLQVLEKERAPLTRMYLEGRTGA